MAERVRIALPAEIDRLRALPAGAAVLLSGPVYTARDATHARLADELRGTGTLPHGLAGQVLFYAGPTPPAAGRPAGAVGPTTARRMDAWTPGLLAAGIAATIGKGARSGAVREACAAHGAVYLAATGGAAAMLATCVVGAEVVAYPDLGTEALVRMEVRDLPAWVAIDASGRDLYAEARAEWAGGAPMSGVADPGRAAGALRGLFITFEGGDGAGKSTQIGLLAERLRERGHEVRTFREPGGVAPGDVGERIREILLDPASAGLDPRAELMLYEASRAQLVAAHYRPALASGAVVLCDRYADSSTAYQGHARQAIPPLDVIEANRIATGGLTPDLSIVLDVDAAVGLEQATAGGADRLEAEGVSFHERVRAGYRAVAEADPDRVKVVPRGSVDEVARAVLALVEPLLGRIRREGGR